MGEARGEVLKKHQKLSLFTPAARGKCSDNVQALALGLAKCYTVLGCSGSRLLFQEMKGPASLEVDKMLRLPKPNGYEQGELLPLFTCFRETVVLEKVWSFSLEWGELKGSVP